MIPEGTTFWGVAAKQFVIGASAFAAGVLLYRVLFVERLRHRPFLALGLFGIAVIIVLIGEAVVHLPLLNIEWRTVVYLLSLIAVAVGFLGDALGERKRKDRGRYL